LQKEFIDDIVYELVHNKCYSLNDIKHKKVVLLFENHYVDDVFAQVLQVLKAEYGIVFEEVEDQSQADVMLSCPPQLLRGRIPFGPSLPKESDLYIIIQEIVNAGLDFKTLYLRVKDQQKQYVYIKDIVLAVFETALKNREIEPFSDELFRDNLFLTYKSVTVKEDELIYFDEQYDDTPKKIQKLVLEVVQDIDRICKKYNIQYFLAGGTLLGAIRHNGFIPWDDDADLMMTREEFEKFEKIVQKELDPRYFWQTSETDSSTYYPFSKIRINHTRYSTEFTKGNKEMHQGIFVDIFVHDNTSNSEFFGKMHLLWTKIYRGILVYKWTNQPMNKRPKVLSKIADAIIKFVPITYWYNKTMKVIKKYRKLSNAQYLYDGMGEHVNNGKFPKQWLSKGSDVQFEGHELPVPDNYEEYLKFLYGNYRDMVIVSKRKAVHDIVELDFGPYNKN